MLRAWFILLASAFGASADNFYVLDGATGAGTTWTDAADQLESPLVRGRTYYVGDGSYNGFTSTTARSGSTLITIKKATAADHGTETGWSSTYGDGVANFTPISLQSDTGYFVFDGATEWGFKITIASGECFHLGNWNEGGSIPNVTIKYTELQGPGGSTPFNYDESTAYKGIFAQPTGVSPEYPNLVISHCKIHGLLDLIQVAIAHDMIVEYCQFYDNTSSNPLAHGNVAFTQESDRAVFRYNKIWNWQTEGLYAAYSGANWRVYGNIAYRPDNANGFPRFMECFSPGTYSGFFFYNNTIVDCNQITMNMLGTGHVVENNIFYNSDASDFTGTSHNYNWWSGATDNGEANGVVGNGAAPFVNYGTDDFHIVSTIAADFPRNKGTNLGSPYNLDMDGTSRTGLWSIGAFEYAASGPVAGYVTNMNVNQAIIQTLRGL